MMNQTLTATLSFLLALAASSPLPADARPNLPRAQLKKLAKGGVHAYSIPPAGGGKIHAGKALGIVEGSPEEVLHMLLDVARYKFYMPQVKASRFVKRRGKTTYAVIETRLPWPVKDAWAYVALTWRRTTGRVFKLRWNMRNGTLKQYIGHAVIEPWSARAKNSVLTYKVVIEPKTAAPGKTISKGVRHAAEMVLHRVRLRIKALRKYKKLPKNLHDKYR